MMGFLRLEKVTAMQVKTGEILVSKDGHYYRVTEVEQDMVSLMRIGGQTVFSCRPAYLEHAFRLSGFSAPVQGNADHSYKRRKSIK